MSIHYALGGMRKKAQIPAPKSELEETLALHIRIEGLPAPQRQYKVDPERRWKVDFAWPRDKLVVECEGGIWILGRHNRGEGFERDCEKYNALALAGWTVLRFTKAMIDSTVALKQISQALGRGG